MNVQNVQGSAQVHSFSKKANGRRGLVEACGLVRRGDVVVSVNGVRLTDKPFPYAVRLLQLAAGEVVLRFRRLNSQSLVEVGNFRGIRASQLSPVAAKATLAALEPAVGCLPTPLPAAQLKQGTVFIPPLRMASRGGLSHRPSSTTTGVIRQGESLVGSKHQVDPANIPPCLPRSQRTAFAPARMLVASADPPPESVPAGGLQVWTPPPPHRAADAGASAAKRVCQGGAHSTPSMHQVIQLLSLFPYWQQEQVLFALFACKHDAVAAVERLQGQLRSSHGSTAVAGSSAMHLPLIRGQHWRSWSAGTVTAAQGGLEKHGKELRIVARSLPGKGVLDIVAWYYAAWKRHAEYSAWKAACQAAKVQNSARDWHFEECSACGQGGDLLCCDWCPGAFHPRCVGGSGMGDAIVGAEDPDEPWMCPVCVGVFRGWNGVSRSAHALQFARQEQCRHATLAAHWKGLRSAVVQSRTAWRTDAKSVSANPPLEVQQAAAEAAVQVQQVLRGEGGTAATGSSGRGQGGPGGATAPRKQPFTFVMGGRKRTRARS